MAFLFVYIFASPVISADTPQQKIFKLQQRLIDSPKDIDTYLHLAMEYALIGNFLRAVENYFALLKVDPNNFHAYNNLGILYRKSGQFKDSLHCYERAAKINPDSYWVPYNMGLCYEAMGRMQEARESYGRALSLNPSFSHALLRLRSLNDPNSTEVIPQLPGLADSHIYLVDSETNQPRIVSNEQTPEPAKPIIVASKPIVVIKKEKVSDQLSKRLKNKKKQFRTTRKGASAMIFNQAMESLEQGNLEKAIELYTTCIISERDFLAEPENDLIRRGLRFLKERPNRMPYGQFYRGLFIYISGNLDLSVIDMNTFLESSLSKKDVNPVYIEEASRIVERHKTEQAAIVAEKEAKEAEEQAIIIAATIASETEVIERPRASNFVIKRMSIDQVIDEADRLSRESRLQDAIAVIEAGLKTNPDEVRLMLKSANAYTDMLLLKGDNEAGKMALARFESIRSIAPMNSREWAISGEMIEELKGRISH